MDEFGLLCEACGRCSIGELQSLAEGSTVASKRLDGGKVDAVVGVICLNALDTERLHQIVDGWFAASNKWESEIRTAQIAYDWLLKDGKRWRPYLLACTYSALNGGTTELPDEVRRLAIAVECFHKASLIHDDIEDNDDLRYGEPAFHRQYGIPVAINVGDLLVGEGYRWITTVENRTAELLRIAAENHRTLCLGQGEELYGLAHENSFTAKEIIEIFRRKTAPAFGVSLLLGAVAAGADRELLETLQSFSESLGIAYQIHDDLEEYKTGEAVDLRASILLALANEAHSGGGTPPFEELMVIEKAGQLLEHYKNEAVRTLNPVKNALLKSLLRRIAVKMLTA
jgi:geranylgeranyl pyrophosphate synthase